MNKRTSIGILNDYQHAALRSADWSALQQTCDVTVVDRIVDLISDINMLKQFEVISIMRERTPFPRSLFEKLPALKLLVTRDPLIFSAITYGRNTHYFPVFFEATRASE